jgi:hypothetical protein
VFNYCFCGAKVARISEKCGIFSINFKENERERREIAIFALFLSQNHHGIQSFLTINITL